MAGYQRLGVRSPWVLVALNEGYVYRVAESRWPPCPASRTQHPQCPTMPSSEPQFPHSESPNPTIQNQLGKSKIARELGAILLGKLRTVFGWTVRVGANVNPRSLRNFPMQGNGAEMMRLAACLATESGIAVCCPVHDAFLIEASSDNIDAETERMQDAMQRASELVLPGFPLKTEAKIVHHPDRYSDPRGERMWECCSRFSPTWNRSGCINCDTPTLYHG